MVLAELQNAVPAGVRIGVTDLAPFDDARSRLDARVADGHSGGLGFVYRDPALATSPEMSFPWGRSIVVAAVPYLREGDAEVRPSPEAGDERSDRPIARFADGDRYDTVRATLAVVQALIEASGARCEQVYDDDRLVDRAVAIRAGVAWAGKSTMAITPSVGPWFLIGSVVTDALIERTDPMARTCGTCTACIPACPTGAIIAPGVLDARRCLAAILQRPGEIPVEFREAVGGRVYGCDDCLVACPPGDKALANAGAREHTASPRRILASTDAEIAVLSAHWYVPKRNARFVRRNAIVALGNTGGEDDIPLLAGLLGHPDALLRHHAEWALRSIGGPTALAILAAAEDGA